MRGPSLPVLVAGGGCATGAGAATPEAELARDGWVRRFVAAPPRLGEAVALYGELGLEVRLEPAADEPVADDCSGCAAAPSQFSVIYTRNAS